MLLVGFTIETYYDARPYERQSWLYNRHFYYIFLLKLQIRLTSTQDVPSLQKPVNGVSENIPCLFKGHILLHSLGKCRLCNANRVMKSGSHMYHLV